MEQIDMFPNFICEVQHKQLMNAVRANDCQTVGRLLEEENMRRCMADAADLAIEHESDMVLDVLLDHDLENLVDLDSLATHAAYHGKGKMIQHLKEYDPYLEFYSLYDALSWLAESGDIVALWGVASHIDLLDLDYGGQRIIRPAMRHHDIKTFREVIDIFRDDYWAMQETYKYLMNQELVPSKYSDVLLEMAPPNEEVVQDTLWREDEELHALILDAYFKGPFVYQRDLPKLLTQAIRLDNPAYYHEVRWHMEGDPPANVLVYALEKECSWAERDLLAHCVGLDPMTLLATPELLKAAEKSHRAIMSLVMADAVPQEWLPGLLVNAVAERDLDLVQELVVNHGVVVIGLKSSDYAIDAILNKHRATMWDLLEE